MVDADENARREDPRERARAAQEAKGRALEHETGGDTGDAPDFGDEHAASGTDPANAPTDDDTEKPTRA